jgi:integrase
MGIYRRGESSQWWMSYTLNGKQYRESTGTADKEEAKKTFADKVSAGKVPDKRSISKLLDDLITDYRINDQNVEWCEGYVERYLRKAFGDKRANALQKQDVKSFMAQMLESQYSNATVNRCLSLLKRAFTIAEIDCPVIEKLKENNVRKGFVDDDTFWKLYEKLPTHQRPVALLAYETGARKQEILTLKWSQVDLEDRIVRLNANETKNDEGRVFSFSDLMYDWFVRLPDVSDYVFTYRGKPLKNIRTGWEEAANGLLFHDLRRSAIRNMVRAGVPERVAMTISGHKTRSVFDRYNIVSEQDVKKAMETIYKDRVITVSNTANVPELMAYMGRTGSPPQDHGGISMNADGLILYDESVDMPKRKA